MTNPSKDLKLRENDLVFVLAQADPGNPNTWEDYKYFVDFGDDKDKEKQEMKLKQQKIDEIKHRP